MAKDKGKSNGEGQGVGKSIYLYKVDTAAGIATVARMPFDQENERGETLVRTSEDVIRAITDGILSQYPVEVKRALAGLVKQSVRADVRGAEAFVSTKIPLTLPDGKKEKPVKTGPVDDEDEEEEETEPTEPVTTEVPVQPWQA